MYTTMRASRAQVVTHNVARPTPERVRTSSCATDHALPLSTTCEPFATSAAMGPKGPMNQLI